MRGEGVRMEWTIALTSHHSVDKRKIPPHGNSMQLSFCIRRKQNAIQIHSHSPSCIVAVPVSIRECILSRRLHKLPQLSNNLPHDERILPPFPTTPHESVREPSVNLVIPPRIRKLVSRLCSRSHPVMSQVVLVSIDSNHVLDVERGSHLALNLQEIERLPVQ